VITQVQGASTTKFAYNPAGLVAKILWNDASSTYFYYDGKLQRYALRQGTTLNYFLWDNMVTVRISASPSGPGFGAAVARRLIEIT
jgi:YD repeat-containing protein